MHIEMLLFKAWIMMTVTVKISALHPPSIPSIPALRSSTPPPSTSSQQLIQLLDRVIADNKMEIVSMSGNNAVLRQLETLKGELVNNHLNLTADTEENGVWSALIGSTKQWTDLPIEVAQRYLDYRLFRTLDGMLSNGQTPYDFFIRTKFDNLKSCQAFTEEVSSRLPDALVEDNPYDAVNSFMNVCLWGLSKDLALISDAAETNSREPKKNSVAMKRRAFFDGIHSQRRMLIRDDSMEVMAALQANGCGGNLAIVLGNTGKELIGDLSFAYTLLALKLCESVTLHAKRYTTSEYGATAVDVAGHISHLADARNSDIWAVRHVGESLREFVYTGRLKVEEDAYWCLPATSPHWEMPAAVEEKLGRSKMVFVKGDEQYRRLLGDREWPWATAAEEVMGYWHVPVCALRVLESTAGCGINPLLSTHASKLDPRFMTSGKWGMIQFVDGRREGKEEGEEK